ncbi:MAG: NAD(P)/FAD-dependent oxidoreductase [Lysobacterales bacterium]
MSTDVVIVGAGPCGLFQVFELGLLDLKSVVVDSISSAGGQCVELYPDKPIYDIPAIPECTGQELVDSLMKQIEPFGARLLLGQEVTEVEPQPTAEGEAGFKVVTATGQVIHCRAVVIAGGLGSFQPRRLRAPGAEEFEDISLHYRVRNPEQYAGKRLMILGGGDSALDWVIALVDIAERITLVHRRDGWRAVDASVNKMKALVSEGRMDLFENARVKSMRGKNGQLQHVELINRAGEPVADLDIDHAMAFFGLAPKLGPIAHWGAEIKGKSLPVDTEKFQTSVAGIYAVGDINTYPGKKKLILSGFHEAALAAFAIKKQIFPDQKVHLQYTTTSPVMHERLGVSPEEQ